MSSEHPERERAKAMRHGPGRPLRSDRPELLRKFLEYIDSTDIPVIQQFCYQNDVGTDQLYTWPEFAGALDKARNKKEANIEIKSLYNEINTRQAIFSLKQLGWSDRTEQTLRGDTHAPMQLIVSEKIATSL
jgi:hypothetical protein